MITKVMKTISVEKGVQPQGAFTLTDYACSATHFQSTCFGSGLQCNFFENTMHCGKRMRKR